MTTKRYLSDPAMTGEVTVTLVEHGDRCRVRLEETPFHVQGGGQKADRGTIGRSTVLDVRYAEDGGVDHFLANCGAIDAGRSYAFEIDPEWRKINAAYHTAGHLLAAVCEAMFPGMHASAGHQWPGEARVDFRTSGEGGRAAAAELVASRSSIEARIREEISRALPVRIVGDPLASRACKIGDYPPIPCGGTHVGCTSEIGSFSIRSIKAKNDGSIRLGYEL